MPPPKLLLIPTPIIAQATYNEARILVGGDVAVAADFLYRRIFRILEGCRNDPDELASEFTRLYPEIEKAYPYNVTSRGAPHIRLVLCDKKARWLRCWSLATRWRTSAIVKALHGHTTGRRLFSGDTVRAGACVPQASLEMPEEKVGSPSGQQVMTPPRIVADFILVHAQFGFGLFEALFDGPPQATHPPEQR